MAEPNQHRKEESLEAPQKLLDALKRSQIEQIFVPPTVDEAVLEGARAHLSSLERPPSHWKPWLSWAAMAACLALAIWLGERYSNPTPVRPFAREDINRDGRVDVLDAFALARQLETGGTDGARWDINGDGRVDGADVKAVAALAVSLTQTRAEQKRSADLSPRREGAIAVWRTEVRAPFFGAVGFVVNMLLASGQHALAAPRSVELYSALSQSCTLPAVVLRPRPGPVPHPADCKSAIRQIENLPYKTSANHGENVDITPVAQCCTLPYRGFVIRRARQVLAHRVSKAREGRS